MGISKIHPIRHTLSKALAYILNPEKTNNGDLISGFGCTPEAETAAAEFRMTASLAEKVNGGKHKFFESGKREVLAYHMIQSFEPEDNLTPEQVHQLGKEWAEAVLGGKFEYVIATHTNTNNLHNHVIFNATSIEDLKKFVSKNNVQLVREKNDLVRRRHGLSITQAKGKSKKPYQQKSFRQQLRTIINETIRQSLDFDDFTQRLQERGVEMKEGKYLAFRMTGQQRFTRDRTLGSNYSREAIASRIEKQHAYRNRVATMARSTKLAATKELANTLMVMRREDIQQFSDFDLRIKGLRQDVALTKSDMSVLRDKTHQQKQAAQLIRMYNKLKPIAEESERKTKAGFQKKHFDKQHAKELETFAAVKVKLEQLGLRTDIAEQKLDSMIASRENEVSRLERDIDSIAERLERLAAAKQIVSRIENGEQFVFAYKSKQTKREQSRNQREEDYSL